MTPEFRDFLLADAQDCRYDIEAESDRNPIQSVRNDMGLRGWCARATAEQFERWAEKGIKSEIHMWTCPKTGQSHVFPVVEDHILDLTASQFAIFQDEPIVLIHYREVDPKRHWFWNTTEIFTNVDSLIRAQQRGRWPLDQHARKARINRGSR